MKITVKSPVQHDGVTYSEGRHDVDDAVGKAMIQSGAAEEGWNYEDGPLSQAGTQNPPGQASPAGGGDQGTAEDSSGTTHSARRSHKS